MHILLAVVIGLPPFVAAIVMIYRPLLRGEIDGTAPFLVGFGITTAAAVISELIALNGGTSKAVAAGLLGCGCFALNCRLTAKNYRERPGSH